LLVAKVAEVDRSESRISKLLSGWFYMFGVVDEDVVGGVVVDWFDVGEVEVAAVEVAWPTKQTARQGT
jgi:hypothetical protein